MKKSMLLPQRHNEMLPTHYEWLLESRRDDAFVQASIRDRNRKARERLRATNEGTVAAATPAIPAAATTVVATAAVETSVVESAAATASVVETAAATATLADFVTASDGEWILL